VARRLRYRLDEEGLIMAESKERKERSLTRLDPFGELEWRSPFGPLFGREGRSLLDELWGRAGARGLAPAIDVSEDDGNYVITAELPGSKREDVNVELHEGVLTIRGEKRSEREEKKEKRRLVERSYGTFSRSFALPADADDDRIAAKFDNGVLTVTVGKRPETKPRVVDIKS
jgi:HSP20 family protein